MKRKYKVIISVAVVAVVSAASIFSIAAEKLPQYRKIVVTSARQKDMNQTINLKGYIEPKAKQEIQLDVTQKIDEVYVQEKQQVHSGELLFALDNSDAAYRLKSEQVNLRSAETELNNLLKSGDKDKKDLNYSISQAQIQYNSAVSDYNTAKVKYEQNQQLYAQGFLSKEELDGASKSLEKLNNNIELSQIQLDKAKDAYGNFDTDRQQQIDKMKSSIELIKMNIDNINSKMDISTKAVIDGVVMNLKLVKGQYPTQETSKIEIYDLSQYVINVFVKQNEAVQIKQGQKAAISVVGLEEKSYVGTILEIGDTASAAQGNLVPMVKVKIAVDQPDENIKVGFETLIKLDLNLKENVVAADFQGIVEDQNGNKFVYLFKDNLAVRKPVKTGVEDGFWVEIVEGLIVGDQYILNPPERVQKESVYKLWSWGYELK